MKNSIYDKEDIKIFNDCLRFNLVSVFGSSNVEKINKVMNEILDNILELSFVEDSSKVNIDYINYKYILRLLSVNNSSNKATVRYINLKYLGLVVSLYLQKDLKIDNFYNILNDIYTALFVAWNIDGNKVSPHTLSPNACLTRAQTNNDERLVKLFIGAANNNQIYSYDAYKDNNFNSIICKEKILKDSTKIYYNDLLYYGKFDLKEYSTIIDSYIGLGGYDYIIEMINSVCNQDNDIYLKEAINYISLYQRNKSSYLLSNKKIGEVGIKQLDNNYDKLLVSLQLKKN